jgi:Bacterial extracellular solute-binding proteins, family 5 Middle
MLRLKPRKATLFARSFISGLKPCASTFCVVQSLASRPWANCGAVLGAAACVAAMGWALAGVGRVEASRRPKYGGTLRVEIGARVNSLDPSVTPATPEEGAAKDEIETLLYDHRNPDGTFGTAGGGVGGGASAGAFRIAAWEPGRHLTLAANEEYSGGRPFVDSVDIEMGRGVKDRLLDIELSKTDFAEIPPEEARAAAERGIRVSTSQPDELVAIVFVAGRPAAEDTRLREALARAIDRTAMVNFILQKEGEPAGGLLPQWSSGTAFLFSTAADQGGAKELAVQIGGSPRIVLGYDANDSLEESLAERIAVDAREAGIHVAPETLPGGRVASNCDARLVRLRMPSPHPRAALASFLATLAPAIDVKGPSEPPNPPPAGPNGAPETERLAEGASAERIYDVERGIVNGYRVVPLVWLPEVYGLSARVRDWKAPAAGEGWPLADVWLEQESQ